MYTRPPIKPVFSVLATYKHTGKMKPRKREDEEMSTDYYGLKAPITRLRVISVGNHINLTVFINHQSAGSLVLRPEELADVALMFADKSVVRLHTSAGKDGPVYSYDIGLDPGLQVVSEYGEIHMLHEIINAHSPDGEEK